MSSATVFTSSPPGPTDPASSSNNGNGGSGGGPTSSPLLFFVALGFGVVFTNLWIIVGVKYCFRYNRRRAAVAAGENGEPIDMATMPRPHRRRREKKLMTMDEVNDQFPLSKYKQWKSSRETNGLPANGGIATAPQSRAPSMKDVEGVIPARDDSPSRPGTALSMARDDYAAAANSSTQPQVASPRASMSPAEGKETAAKSVQHDGDDEKSPVTRMDTVDTTGKGTASGQRDDDDSDDEDDPIRTATAPEMMGEPGDTCAICLDTLEDDDDVRGLTCGHAFHASCVDPWLTSRRACCPLCKADYYVPKARPEGEAADQSGLGRRPGGLGSPSAPQAVWTTTRSNPFSRSRVMIVANPGVQQQGQRADRFGRLSRPSRQTRPEMTEASSNTGWRSRLQMSQAERPAFPNWFGRNRGTEAPQPTPGQLEAGTGAGTGMGGR